MCRFASKAKRAGSIPDSRFDMSLLRTPGYSLASLQVMRFGMSEEAWSRLMKRLEEPARTNLGIAHLFSQPSVFSCGTDENPAKEPG